MGGTEGAGRNLASVSWVDVVDIPAFLQVCGAVDTSVGVVRQRRAGSYTLTVVRVGLRVRVETRPDLVSTSVSGGRIVLFVSDIPRRMLDAINAAVSAAGAATPFRGCEASAKTGDARRSPRLEVLAPSPRSSETGRRAV
jgi:hypothetical protein